MDSGELQKTVVSQHSSLLHLLVQSKAYKAKAIHQQHPEKPSQSLGPNTFEMDRHKVEKLCCGLTSSRLKLFLEIMDVAAQEGKDHPDC